MPDWIFYLYYTAVSAVLLSVWIPGAARNSIRYGSLAKVLGYEKIRQEAIDAGWSLTRKEFAAILVSSIVVVGLIALFTGNYFFVTLGIALMFTLPRAIVLRIKRANRRRTLFDLPPNLRLFIAKLSDFGNVQKSLENALPEMEGVTKPAFEAACNKLRVGMPLDRVLDEWLRDLKIRKLEDFAERLKLAAVEGFHRRSLDSLKDTVAEIDEDITAIKTLDIEARSKKKQLFLISVMSWAMPLLMSFMNNNNGNVYLNTVYGQIFIVSFAASTLYAIMKGGDYLSLNLDEL